jgi:pimeloyl-ACP methyl ester carboxylesterase
MSPDPAPAPWSGPFTVVCVHGNGGGSMRFELALPFVPAPAVWRAVTLPGFQGVPERPDMTTMAAWGAALGELVDAARGDGPVVLLGHGIGGSMALELLQQRPGAVDALILHAPVGARLDTRLFPRIMSLPGIKPVVRRLIANRALRPLWRRLFFERPVDRAYLDRFFGEYRRCRPFAAMFDLITAPWFDALRPLDLPALLVWGSGDRVLDASQIDAFARVLPRAATVTVEGWDHFPMIEQPAEYAERITAMAASLLGGSPP